MTDEVLVALRRIMRATDLHSRRLLRKFGITGPQLLVLREIAARRELSSSAVAQAVRVSLPTATGIMARLETRDLVARQRNSSDRRQVVVSLTEAGRRVLDSAPPPLQEWFTEQLGALPEWEQTQILYVLQRIAAMMEVDTLPVSPVLATGEIDASGPAAEPALASDRAGG